MLNMILALTFIIMIIIIIKITRTLKLNYNYNFGLYITLVTCFLSTTFSCYLYLVRYIRLGNDLDLSLIYDKFCTPTTINFCIFILFTWPFFLTWFRLIFREFLHIRLLFNNIFHNILHIVHIHYLRYTAYFKFMEYVYKLSVIWTYIVLKNLRFSPSFPLIFRKIVNFIYKRPFVLGLSVLFFACSELYISKGHLHYTLYVTFAWFSLRVLLSSAYSFSFSSWVRDCCEADYISGNWDYPRYTSKFWFWLPYFRALYNNIPTVSQDIADALPGWIAFMKERSFKADMRRLKLAARIESRPYSTPFQKIKIGYMDWSKLRWVHTSSTVSQVISSNSGFLHKATVYFSKTAFDYAACINSNWAFFHSLEKLKVNFPYNEITYKNTPIPLRTKWPFDKVVEHNLKTNFCSWSLFGTELLTYQEAVSKGLKRDSYHQACDDIIIDNRNAHGPIIDRKIRGLDQKAYAAKNIKDASSLVLSNVSVAEYNTILRNHYNLLQSNCTNLSYSDRELLEKTLINLDSYSNIPHKHFDYWLESVHVFPNEFVPPIKVPNNFSILDFSEESLREYNLSREKVEKISAILYKNNVQDTLDGFTKATPSVKERVRYEFREAGLHNIDPSIFS